MAPVQPIDHLTTLLIKIRCHLSVTLPTWLLSDATHHTASISRCSLTSRCSPSTGRQRAEEISFCSGHWLCHWQRKAQDADALPLKFRGRRIFLLLVRVTVRQPAESTDKRPLCFGIDRQQKPTGQRPLFLPASFFPGGWLIGRPIFRRRIAKEIAVSALNELITFISG
jgi:hypothetical protein